MSRPVLVWWSLVFASMQAGAEPLEFKGTLSRYTASDGRDASDLNLRGSAGAYTAWVGWYSDRSGFRQARSGFEHRAEWGSQGWVRSVVSLQSAAGGAWVGSINAELGGDTFALLGWGRTNLRPYINLNFDPNDMVTVGVGHRSTSGLDLALFAVVDDRLHTGQRVTHATARWRWGSQQRLTVDVSAKQGHLPGEGPSGSPVGPWVHDRSLSLTYDQGPHFIRWAHDPHAGFGAAHQTRVSVGSRF